MTGSEETALLTVALGQVGVATALIIFAIVGAGWAARSMAFLAALAVGAGAAHGWFVPAATQAPGAALTLGAPMPGVLGGSLALPLAVVVAAAAAGAVVLALVVGRRRLAPRVRATSASGSRERKQTFAAEARNKRLLGILQREHQKLRDVKEMHRYFELATRNSQITVLFQDPDLRYQWVVNPRPSLIGEGMIGLTDEEALPPEVRPLVIGHKTRALQTGMTQTFEVQVPGKDERAWFRMDVVPISDGKRLTGLVCTAIDISRSKRLDAMRTDLSRRLAETLQRFNLALRSERIMVFSQDTSLRYTWANTDETQVGSIIGRTDLDVIPESDREPIVSLKTQVIATRRPASGEVGVGDGADRRWYDLHVEPNLRPDGSVAGITCASVDITHRKRNEEQMRLVMRELTHRTKNLLTVVIAIARQTSNQATTVETFVPALIARLRALSAAQDLIVADEWAGVDMGDLVRVLVGQFMPPHSSRVTVAGPQVVLSPEASQNLGLAIHELAANAVQYGAFANASGTLEVTWAVTTSPSGEDQLVLTWTERGGPTVNEPTRRGFGMTVIERNLSRALGAKVSLAFGASGLTASVTLPLEGIVPFASPDRIRLAQAS
ncbi:sensor histidine kinase [Acuticoccus sp.]|uniref:sensor histidine kinase n=1 Tax=Acuticoccus sp. TaxID=1904378 RepID=UPI003B52138E